MYIAKVTKSEVISSFLNNKKRSRNRLLFLFLFFLSTTSFSQQTFHIEVSSSNLSEDYSPISTKDDELIFCLITKDSSYCSSFVLDSITTHHHFSFVCAKAIDPTEYITVVLLELDSEKNQIELSEICKKQSSELQKSFDDMNIQQTNKILGDDDLIFIKNTRSDTLKNLDETLTGFHLFDKYFYQIKITTF